MTIVKKPPQSGATHTRKRWYTFRHANEAVRHTEAWEHENFAEEQARWERSDPAYARICEEVRQANKNGEKASRRAEEAKAEWDARVAPQRQANDDAEKAHHALRLKADQTARRQTATPDAASEAPRSLPGNSGPFNPDTNERLHAAPDGSWLPVQSPRKGPTL